MVPILVYKMTKSQIKRKHLSFSFSLSFSLSLYLAVKMAHVAPFEQKVLLSFFLFLVIDYTKLIFSEERDRKRAG